MLHVSIVTSISLFVCTTTTLAGIVGPIGPFTGDVSESFDSFFLGEGPVLDIFGADSFVGDTAGQLAPATATFGSSFLGSTISPLSGGSFAHATEPVNFTFFTPVSEFGGFMATNSGADGGLVDFYDVDDALIASLPLEVTFAPGQAKYTWNGWTSSIPIGRVHIQSNGVLNGFLGFDDMQANFAPVPTPASGLLLLAIPWCRRRRRP